MARKERAKPPEMWGASGKYGRNDKLMSTVRTEKELDLTLLSVYLFPSHRGKQDNEASDKIVIGFFRLGTKAN